MTKDQHNDEPKPGFTYTIKVALAFRGPNETEGEIVRTSSTTADPKAALADLGSRVLAMLDVVHDQEPSSHPHDTSIDDVLTDQPSTLKEATVPKADQPAPADITTPRTNGQEHRFYDPATGRAFVRKLKATYGSSSIRDLARAITTHPHVVAEFPSTTAVRSFLDHVSSGHLTGARRTKDMNPRAVHSLIRRLGAIVIDADVRDEPETGALMSSLKNAGLQVSGQPAQQQNLRNAVPTEHDSSESDPPAHYYDPRIGSGIISRGLDEMSNGSLEDLAERVNTVLLGADLNPIPESRLRTYLSQLREGHLFLTVRHTYQGRKPNPMHYRAILEACGVGAEDPLYRSLVGITRFDPYETTAGMDINPPNDAPSIVGTRLPENDDFEPPARKGPVTITEDRNLARIADHLMRAARERRIPHTYTSTHLLERDLRKAARGVSIDTLAPFLYPAGSRRALAQVIASKAGPEP